MVETPIKAAGVAGAEALKVAVEANVDAPENITLGAVAGPVVVHHGLTAEEIMDHRRNHGSRQDVGGEHREDNRHRERAEEIFGGAFEEEDWDENDTDTERGNEGGHRDLLRAVENGLEERLLEAVLHGKIPVTIAVGISGATDDESQRLLMEAYERKDMNQKTLTAFKRVLDQRRYFGRKYSPRHRESPRRTSAESLVRAYRLESQRQKLMVRKAKICEARLLSASAALKVLVTDEDYVNLLRAEKLETMPKFLAERARQAA